jgi:hypothetical protein
VTLSTGHETRDLNRRIYIHTNDPSQKMVKLKIEAKVKGN